MISSPPYADSWHASDGEKHVERMRKAGYSEEHIHAKKWKSKGPGTNREAADYGTTFGQLGTMKPGPSCETPMNEVETLSWDKDTCYGLSWQGLITPESFAHPAKMARGQLFRLVRWLFETGRIRKGEVILDCFAGVGTTGIAAASSGCRFVGVELEPKFAALAQANFEIHRHVWKAAGDPQPVILCGDSRKLAEVAGPVLAQCCVSSPPYAESLRKGEPTDPVKIKANEARDIMAGKGITSHYGHTPGNLGNLPPGDALASGVVSSPPYEGVTQGTDGSFRDMRAIWNADPKNDGKPGFRPNQTGDYSHAADADSYGTTEGNVGNTSGETFWSAARQIVEQCHLLLKPGATTCWVVKSYVKAGKIVPFPDQWAVLLESTGFRVTHRIRCHLVSETREADLFGGETVKRKERKSFFRRLHEKKSPHTRIDFEEIVIAVKVGEGGSAGAVVSSPPFHDSLNSTDKTFCVESKRTGKWAQRRSPESVDRQCSDYGHAAGQLGGLPPGIPPRRCNQCGKGDDGCQCCVPEE